MQQKRPGLLLLHFSTNNKQTNQSKCISPLVATDISLLLVLSASETWKTPTIRLSLQNSKNRWKSLQIEFASRNYKKLTQKWKISGRKEGIEGGGAKREEEGLTFGRGLLLDQVHGFLPEFRPGIHFSDDEEESNDRIFLFRKGERKLGFFKEALEKKSCSFASPIGATPVAVAG